MICNEGFGFEYHVSIAVPKILNLYDPVLLCIVAQVFLIIWIKLNMNHGSVDDLNPRCTLHLQSSIIVFAPFIIPMEENLNEFCSRNN